MAALRRECPVGGIGIEEYPVTTRSGFPGIVVAHFRHPHHQPGLAGINYGGAVVKPVLGFLGVAYQHNHIGQSGYIRYGCSAVRERGGLSFPSGRICR